MGNLLNGVEVYEGTNENWGVCKDNRVVTRNHTELREVGNSTSSEASIGVSVLYNGECGRDISEKKYYGYIYETTNLVNGKKYIGQHKSKTFDLDYYGSGKIILQALKKYGVENFKCSVIEWCSSRKEANERERYWIAYYNATKSSIFYNISDGGNNYAGMLQKDMKEIRAKMRKAHLGEKNHRYGVIPSEETREKIRKSLTGKTASEETKKKQSESHSGENHYMYGKKYSEEMKKRFSESHKGIYHTEEAKKKMSMSRTGKKRPREVAEKINAANRKKIQCVETGEVFACARDVMISLGFDGSSVSTGLYGCARSGEGTYKGFHWRYIK